MIREMNPLRKEEFNVLIDAYDAKVKRSEDEYQEYINKKIKSGEYIIEDSKIS